MKHLLLRIHQRLFLCGYILKFTWFLVPVGIYIDIFWCRRSFPDNFGSNAGVQLLYECTLHYKYVQFVFVSNSPTSCEVAGDALLQQVWCPTQININ